MTRILVLLLKMVQKFLRYIIFNNVQAFSAYNKKQEFSGGFIMSKL